MAGRTWSRTSSSARWLNEAGAGKVGAAVEQRDEGTAAGEPDGGLSGGVAAADDGDTGGAAQLRLGRAGRIEHAQALVVREFVEREPPVGGAGGEHDCARCDLVFFFESY